jgi:hypothetical protein
MCFHSRFADPYPLFSKIRPSFATLNGSHELLGLDIGLHDAVPLRRRLLSAGVPGTSTSDRTRNVNVLKEMCPNER